MKHFQHTRNRSATTARRRSALHLIDALEPRRLFTLNLFIAGNVLHIQEDAHGNNDTIIQNFSEGSGIQIRELNDVLSDTPAMFNLGWNQSNDSHTETGPVSTFTSIVVDTLDGSDTLEIPSLDTPLTVDPSGAASENLELGGQNGTNGAEGITSQIYFNGTNAKAIAVNVDDREDPNGVSATLTSTSITGLADAPIYFSPAVGAGADPGVSVSIDTGDRALVDVQQTTSDPTPLTYSIQCFGATSTINAQQLNANSSLNINCQQNAVADVNVGENSLLSTVQGSLTVNGNAGSINLSLDDSADTGNHTFTTTGQNGALELDEDGSKFLNFDNPITGFNLQTDIFQTTVNLDLTSSGPSTSTATVDLNGENDTVNVNGLAFGETLNLIASAGITNTTINAVNVSNTVNITDPIGQVALTLDGSSLFQSQAVSINGGFVSGLGAGTYVYTDILSSLTVIGGTDFDNFSVSPNIVFPLTVNGGPDEKNATDRLAITNPQLFKNISLAFTAGSTTAGTFTIPGQQPISFIGIATVDPAFGQLTGTIFNAQNAALLSGITVFVDQNANGTFDTGEPTATSDATGTFTFLGLPAGTFNLLTNSTAFALTTPISITVAANALSTATTLAVIPTPVSTGPDLNATTTVAPSKLANIKPKVTVKITNLAASTAAATVQILLFASTDQTLDPTDIALFTTTAPINLKTKKSKSFTFTPSTPASFTKGTYYILAAIDTTNAIPESNESNNVAASPKTTLLAPPYVDLTGKFAPLPKTAKKSKILPITLTLQNLGTIPAASTIDITLYASTDQTLDANDTPLATNSPVTLHIAANKTQPAKFKLSLANLTAGSYYLIAKINTTDSQPESDLTNNTIFSPTAITIS